MGSLVSKNKAKDTSSDPERLLAILQASGVETQQGTRLPDAALPTLLLCLSLLHKEDKAERAYPANPTPMSAPHDASGSVPVVKA